MKTFRVHELRIVSRREQTALRVQFHPKVTVIKGENDTGKSSIVKCLYWCLGAEPAKTSDRWTGAEVAAALSFSVDLRKFTAVRHRDTFAILDSAGNTLLATNNVTNVLAPFLADLFDFELLLSKRESSEGQIPPPAFYLLPYYTDQDVGWKANWCSFARLTQYKDWTSDVAEYHIGLKGNEFYRKKTELAAVKAAMEEPRRQEKAVSGAIAQVRKRLASITVDFDVERFRAEISELVRAAEGLAADEESYRAKVGQLSETRTLHLQQLEIATGTLKELRSEYRQALAERHEVSCPMCGAEYHNSMVERFAIASDEAECEAIITDLHARLAECNKALQAQQGKLTEARTKHERVWELLQTKRQEVTLQEMIASEARGQAIQALQGELEVVQRHLGELATKADQLGEALSALISRKRREAFLDEFWRLFRSHCITLQVRGPTRTPTFVPKLNDVGSDLPRLVLAYNVAILRMAWAHGSAARAPIVLDSPHQQDPDPVNRRLVCEFIADKLPDDAQLILALVDPQGVDFRGAVVEHVEKFSVLRREEYPTVGREVLELVQAMYAHASE